MAQKCDKKRRKIAIADFLVTDSQIKKEICKSVACL
jgi:hypothetical protein